MADEEASTKKSEPRKRQEKALSAAFVRTASKPGKYFDGHGLFLKVEASGARRWVQRIVIRGKRTEIGLGSASLVTLADARATAVDNRKLARAGGDPLQAKREAQALLTFEEAAREVHAIHKPTWRNPQDADAFFQSAAQNFIAIYAKVKNPLNQRCQLFAEREAIRAERERRGYVD